MGIGDRLEREEQLDTGPRLGSQGHILSNPEAISGGLVSVEEAMNPESLPKEIQALIWRCMEGAEPPDRPLEENEVQKFNSNHVNVVLLSVGGARNRVIAQMLGMNQVYIARTLLHPYAVKIRSALLATKSTKVIEMKTRLDEMAEDLAELTYEYAMKSNDLKTIARVTFGMLDRAGYGPTSTVRNEAPAPAAATGNTLARLAQALEASERVDVQVMPGRAPSVPPNESVDAAPTPVPEPVAEHPDLRRVG